jgi:hypothetical protein
VFDSLRQVIAHATDGQEQSERQKHMLALARFAGDEAPFDGIALREQIAAHLIARGKYEL